MKITIIAPSSFGYINFLVEALDKKPEVKVTHINFSSFKYEYKSVADKLKNALKKTFFKTNIKDQYRSKKILEVLNNNEIQDFIVVIRPDQLALNTIKNIKKHTKLYYAFYFDAILKFPKKINLILEFDKVFSYEKDDVKTYNLEFITNFIYDTNKIENTSIDFEVYNISSFDERYTTLEKFAEYFKANNINYKIEVRKENTQQGGLIDVIPNYKSLTEVKHLIFKSKIVLDIQKEDQKGISFRAFEALGYNKKLITTNVDIINYDFYNPNNIFVVKDVDNIDIPATFFNTKYSPVEPNILDKYKLDGWINTVFNI